MASRLSCHVLSWVFQSLSSIPEPYCRNIGIGKLYQCPCVFDSLVQAARYNSNLRQCRRFVLLERIIRLRWFTFLPGEHILCAYYMCIIHAYDIKRMSQLAVFQRGANICMNSPLRKPTNLSIDSELLEEAKAMRVNLSRAAETGLRAAVADAKSELH